jgi:hypothetical protein
VAELVEELFQAARVSIDGGEPFPTQFVIPDGQRTWRVVCPDLAAAGENDFGIPPKVFAHGVVGTLVASLGAQKCYEAEDLSVGSTGNRAVVVTVFGRGRLSVNMQPYEADPEGGVVWGERILESSNEPGRLGASLPLWRALNREPGPMPQAEALLEDMTESGFFISVEAGNGAEAV